MHYLILLAVGDCNTVSKRKETNQQPQKQNNKELLLKAATNSRELSWYKKIILVVFSALHADTETNNALMVTCYCEYVYESIIMNAFKPAPQSMYICVGIYIYEFHNAAL